MNGRGQSDSPIVPEKRSNNGTEERETAATVTAEGVEGRGLAKGNSNQQNRSWTLGQPQDLQSALERVRQIAERDKAERFTSLYHLIYQEVALEQAYFSLKPKAAPGVDGETWKSYGENLRENLEDLSRRLRCGAYRARPVRRTYIPKPDGRQRPIGVTALEDKIVQCATARVLDAIYEPVFCGCSYGFRTKRKAHDALDAVTVAIETGKVNWVLDADIRGFFDAIDHDRLIELIQLRIGDQRVIRLIQKWLKAGVLEKGILHEVEEGTPQGGNISPKLANIYLHYVLDRWTYQWRREQARGEVYIVRYADDFVMGFQFESDARRFWAELQQRFAEFNLELHGEKTRLIEFGRFAAVDRRRRGLPKPETFTFLSFDHICSRTRTGKFCVLRRPTAKRRRAKLQKIKEALRLRMHQPIAEVGAWLAKVLSGWYQYFAVPRTSQVLQAFRRALIVLWWHTLRRRSQRGRIGWRRMLRLADPLLPIPHILHPYPNQRLRVTTQGKSPVR